MDDDSEAVAENVSVASEFLLPTKYNWEWDGIGHQKNQKFTYGGALMVGLSYDKIIVYFFSQRQTTLWSAPVSFFKERSKRVSLRASF